MRTREARRNYYIAYQFVLAKYGREQCQGKYKYDGWKLDCINVESYDIELQNKMINEDMERVEILSVEIYPAQ